MGKRVLDVGNCEVDHGAIRALVEQQFEADVVQVDSAAEALAELRSGHFDLVLVNRIFDYNGDDGLSLVRAVKADAALAAVPVILLTNYPQYAQEAIASGAAPGFGKRELHLPATLDKLRVHLS